MSSIGGRRQKTHWKTCQFSWWRNVNTLLSSIRRSAVIPTFLSSQNSSVEMQEQNFWFASDSCVSVHLVFRNSFATKSLNTYQMSSILCVLYAISISFEDEERLSFSLIAAWSGSLYYEVTCETFAGYQLTIIIRSNIVLPHKNHGKWSIDIIIILHTGVRLLLFIQDFCLFGWRAMEKETIGRTFIANFTFFAGLKKWCAMITSTSVLESSWYPVVFLSHSPPPILLI